MQVSISEGPVRLIGLGLLCVRDARTENGVTLAAEEVPVRDLIFPATRESIPPGTRVGPIPNETDSTEDDCHMQIEPGPRVLIPN